MSGIRLEKWMSGIRLRDSPGIEKWMSGIRHTSSNHMSVPCTDISTIDKPLDEKFAQLFTEIREALVENFEEVLNGNRFEKKRFDWQDLK